MRNTTQFASMLAVHSNQTRFAAFFLPLLGVEFLLSSHSQKSTPKVLHTIVTTMLEVMAGNTLTQLLSNTPNRSSDSPM